MPKKNVAVVGSGVAGLACAARLAASGFSVTIFEQNNAVGGKLGLLQDSGYSWDTGPSLFTQPHLMRALFTDCGRKLEDFFSYRALKEGTQYFWEDGTRLHAAPARNTLLANVGKAFNIPTDALRQYLDDAGESYHKIAGLFLDRPIHRLSAWDLSGLLPALEALKPAYLTRSLHSYNLSRLAHPALVQMMDRMATYNGSDPYQCPAMLSTIAHLEFNEGVWYAEGGMISIPAALRRLCESLGVTFQTGASVTRILLKDKQVIGAVAGGAEAPTDAVISNSDVFFTYRDLLGDAEAAKRIARQERSSSGVIFYWGIGKTFPELRLHNVFFSADYEGEFRAIFRDGTVSADPTVYVNITSRQEASHAPPGCENWFVLVNAPAQLLSEAAVAGLRTSVLDKLSRLLGTDISALIRCEHVIDPAGIQAGSGSFMGALYGTASNSLMAAFNRHPNYSKKYRGLFFAGGTVHPGGGIPLCLRSGKLAADAAAAYLAS